MKTFISPIRISPQNPTGCLADELKEQLDSIEYDPNSRPAMVSTFDILTDDLSSYTPPIVGLQTVRHDGETIQLAGAIRGLSNYVSSGNGKPEAAQAISEWLVELSAKFADAVPLLEDMKEFNDNRFNNEIKFNAAQELFHKQRVHETNLDDLNVKLAEGEEQHYADIEALKAENAELKSNQESLLSKITGLMKPAKKPAAAKKPSTATPKSK